uniref:Cycloeucalenol cycloisomerase-like n=1 Tax=Elaeis guineensis var. tenera TaxID=51953 RepID=A0A6I9R1U1_ELAGV|nr:cycloeucalenol cycloisomerase-like [Elaeis guineensis]
MSSGSSAPCSSESSSASNPQVPVSVDEPASAAGPRLIFASGTIPCFLTSEELLLIRIQYGVPPEYDLELPGPSDRPPLQIGHQLFTYIEAVSRARRDILQTEERCQTESFAELEYLLVGLMSALPYLLIPIKLVGDADKGRCWKDRYWVKGNLWIMIFSFVGNYFLTHYFFTVLGASYTFPSWTMNNVPHATFLLAHCCFILYHTVSNMTLRRVRQYTACLPYTSRVGTEAAWILLFGYFIAYLETLAISNFPYYDFVDRASMYKTGSLFYAMYFIVSFPMFSRIDEIPGDRWDLKRVAVDALGASMLVTIILDLWRLFLGPIVPVPEPKQCSQPALVWFGIPE